MFFSRINNYKEHILALHLVGLVICAVIACNQIQLRWHLGYFIFWITAFSGIIFVFFSLKRYWSTAIIKLYGFCWILFSLIGLFISVVIWQSTFCETEEYIMRESKGFMGFETATLYKKCGLQEIELHHYELVYPKSITPIDSLGAIIIYGNFPNGEGGSDEKTVIYPMRDDIYFDNIDKIKKYAEQEHYEYINL